MATHAGFSTWKQAQPHVQEIVNVLSTFSATAKELGIKTSTVALMTQQLNQT